MSIIRSGVTRIRDLFDRSPIPPLFFEEPEVARYVTVTGSASGFTIPDPGSLVNDRHVPGIHAPGLVKDSLPVIFFRTRHKQRPRFAVRLNTTHLTQHTFTDDGPHSWHEIIPANTLKPENNELTFAVSGDGDVTFSDVVILYTSNKLTVRRRREPPVVLDPNP